MSQSNIYKPRYKIAFQAKSKIWPYKNSRLRRFFNIRGRKLIRRGLFKRYFLVFNNMKWTIARRYIRPYMKKRRPLRRRFRNIFYLKQQLRAFYGKQKEEAFRNFFKRFLGGAKGRNNMFAVALERRADMVLFRLRFLPTIYGCHQFIHHFGININGKKEKSPYALVRAGDIITFEKEHWVPFVEYLYERLYWRVYGLTVWKKRQFKALRKKVWWCYKNKFFKKSNAVLLRKFSYVLRKVLKINGAFSQYIPLLYKEIKEVEIRSKNKNLNDNRSEIFANLRKNVLLYWKDYRTSAMLLIKKINRLYKRKWRLKSWTWRYYYAYYFALITTIFRLYKNLKYYFSKLKVLELTFCKNLLFFSKDYSSKDDLNVFKNLKLSADHKIENLNDELSDLILREKILIRKENLISTSLLILKKKYKSLLWKIVANKIAVFKKQNNIIQNSLNYINSLNKKRLLIQNELKSTSDKIRTINATKKNIKLTLDTDINVLSKNIASKTTLKNDLLKIINKQGLLIKNELELFNEKIDLLMNFILKRRIKRYSLKPNTRLDLNSGKKVVQKSPLIYFLTKRRFKKERKLAIPRLKKVHWYLPPYIYFDVRTLRAVYLYNPKPEEITYSFKCSLRSIHSFYRSLGI